MEIIAIYFVVQCSTAVWLYKGWGRRSFSQRLLLLNKLLLFCVALLIVFRYGEEIALLAKLDRESLRRASLVLAPMYGALLITHIFANHQFFSKGPLRRPIVIVWKSLASSKIFVFGARVWNALKWRIAKLRS